MTLRELINGLDEELLDVKVIVKVPGASGTYIQSLGITKVQKDLVEEYHDCERTLDLKHSAIVIHTTPKPGV